MTKLYIDGDACPVTDICIKVCKSYDAECIIICDFNHNINKAGATTITVSKGSDSADFALVNMIDTKSSIVVTADYGLAAMCLAKGAKVINPDGLLYTNDNIDSLLFYRHEAKKAMRAGKRPAHIPKRTSAQNEQFEKALTNLFKERL